MQLADELLGRAVSERLVRPELVVVAPPIFDDQPRMGERSKLVLVEAFVSETAVERFDVGVLGRLARVDEVQPNTPITSPAGHCDARELGPVVHHQGLRIAADRSDRIEDPSDANT